MKISVITVGKIKEKYLRDAIAEYSKRLSRYCRLEIIEVADERTLDQASEAVEENIRTKEGERLLKYVRDDMYVITLEIGGKMLDRPGKRGAEAVGLCAQLFKDDVSAPVDAGGAAGTGVSGVSDYQWRTIS